MNKPLMIDELKALEVGDWVWIVPSNSIFKPYYGQIKKYTDKPLDKELWINSPTNIVRLCYSDYGTTWLAYKNKEQAQAKGEIVELPCLRDVKNSIMGKQKQLLYVGVLGYVDSTVYNADEFDEAERCLADLKGEKL